MTNLQKRDALAVMLPATLFTLFSAYTPLRFGLAATPAFFADDFFYYVLIAGRLAQGGASSFDGETLTNGYHPLWMLVLTAVSAVTGGTGPAFLAAVMAIILGATLSGLWLVLRLLQRDGELGGTGSAALLIFAVAFAWLARTGMEVTLAIPLALLLLDQMDLVARGAALRPILMGVLAAATVLARLDCLLLVILAGAAVFVSSVALRDWPRQLGGVAIGFSPVLVYLVFNHLHFGGWMPISGAAKGLAPGIFINHRALAIGYGRGDLDIIGIATLIMPNWAIAVCALAGLARWPHASPPARLRTAICLFPPSFFLIHALRSDWMIWPWYFYPVAIALPFAATAIRAGLPVRSQWRPMGRAIGLTFGLTILLLETGGQWFNQRPSLNGGVITAQALRDYAATHPGRYAMGDRAGITAYLGNMPLFQLEGIVGDTALITDIANRTALLPVLRAHRIDYYIGHQFSPAGACLAVREPAPAQAGSRSPAMSGQFCAPPVFRFKDAEGQETRVFRVPPPQQPATG